MVQFNGFQFCAVNILQLKDAQSLGIARAYFGGIIVMLVAFYGGEKITEICIGTYFTHLL